MGVGVILESKRDSKRGVIATVLNQNGVMKVGDSFVVGTAYGKIRAMLDENGVRHETIPPTTPVEILGINGEPPHVGDSFYIVPTEKEARHIADKRRLIHREESLAHKKHVTLLSLRDKVENQELKSLQIIVKGDVQGSIQAITDSLQKLSNSEVEVRIIHHGIGNVNESDILLAKASDAVIFTFHVSADSGAKAEAEREGIEIRNYEIIFELLEDVRAAMEGMLEPDIVEEVVAKAEVMQKFDLSAGIIAGSTVKEGTLKRGSEVHVYRGGAVILTSKIGGLKRFKEDVREVGQGFECGILIDGYKDIQPGDSVHSFIKKTITRRLKTNA
jgi:translation initiation factor IF-2